MISTNTVQWITTREPPNGEAIRGQWPSQHEQRSALNLKEGKECKQNHMISEGRYKRKTYQGSEEGVENNLIKP